jgi:hypothetical protein
MIHSGKPPSRKTEIDLSGPQGNAFCLLGIAKQLCEELNLNNWEDIRRRMMAGNYNNLIEIFDEEFGDYVDLYRSVSNAKGDR